MPFKSTDNDYEEVKLLQDVLYSLAIKICSNECSNTIIRNFTVILSTLIQNIEHHLVLSRETPQDKYFHYIFTIVKTIRIIFQENKSPYIKVFDNFVYNNLISLLSKPNRSKAIAGIKLVSEFYEMGSGIGSIIVNNCAQVIHRMFGILTKLPCKFCYEIQQITKDLSLKIITKYIKQQKENYASSMPSNYHSQNAMKSSFKNLKTLITRLLPILFNVNIHLQKLSITLFNDLKNLIGERMFCNILLGYDSESTQNRIITISDLMASCTPVAGSVNNLLDLNKENYNIDSSLDPERPGTLLGHLFVYIFET